MIIANEEAIKVHNLKPLARVVDYAVVGVDPTIMGIGPAPAIKQLLNKQGLSLNEIDLIEVSNELCLSVCIHRYRKTNRCVYSICMRTHTNTQRYCIFTNFEDVVFTITLSTAKSVIEQRACECLQFTLASNDCKFKPYQQQSLGVEVVGMLLQ